MRKIVLFVNPLLQRAGSRRKDVAGVVRVFREAGASFEVVETAKARGAGVQAKRAIAEGFDGIVVCGGDGTIFDVIQGVAGSQVPLGIIPFGTGNILAQNLKIPKNPVSAAQCLMSGVPVAVPLGKITTCLLKGGRQSWLFATSAGMGMHAALMVEARRSGKDVVGRAAYFVAGVHLLVKHPIQTFDLEVETVMGEVFREQVSEALAVRVAQLNRWRPGGGLTLPFLRLATVGGCSRLRLARASFEALALSAGARDRVTSERAAAKYRDVKRVVVRPIPHFKYQPALAVQADGEVLGVSCAEIEMAGVSVRLLAATPRLDR
jgi:diacylglycerol kinase (ATP)